MFNTTLCYIRRGGSYLMLHRVKKEHDRNRDMWIGVGGALEINESPYEGMRREIGEETGLEIRNLKYRGIVTFAVDDGEGEYMHLFTASSDAGEPKECDEGVLEWVDIRDVPKLPIWEGDRLFLRLLEENVPFFEMKLLYHSGKLIEAYLDGEKMSI